MKVPSELLKVSRVLHEDDDFVTLEVAKHDNVTFHLGQNEEGETVGGDRFLTVLFVRATPEAGAGAASAWDPFA